MRIGAAASSATGSAAGKPDEGRGEPGDGGQAGKARGPGRAGERTISSSWSGTSASARPTIAAARSASPTKDLEARAREQDRGRADGAHDGRRFSEFDALHPSRPGSLVGAGPTQRQSAQRPDTSSRWPVVTKPCAAEIRSSHGSSSQSVELDDAVAARADEMVVVPVSAEAVAELALAVGERVDHALVGEEPERAVDGGEPEPLAAPAQALVELLRGHVVVLLHQLGEDRQALPRRPDADALEQLDGPRLLGRWPRGYASTA